MFAKLFLLKINKISIHRRKLYVLTIDRKILKYKKSYDGNDKTWILKKRKRFLVSRFICSACSRDTFKSEWDKGVIKFDLRVWIIKLLLDTNATLFDVVTIVDMEIRSNIFFLNCTSFKNSFDIIFKRAFVSG